MAYQGSGTPINLFSINSFSINSFRQVTGGKNVTGKQAASSSLWTAPASVRVGFMAFLLSLGGAIELLITSPAVVAQTATSPNLVAQVPVGATVLHVNPAFGSDTPGAGTSTSAPYRTITYALQQAKPGTTVQLERGTYTQQTGEVFPLAVPAGVVLQGNEADKGQTIVIIGGGSFVSRTFARQNMTILLQSNSEVRGVTVTNPNTRGTGIWIEAGNATVENCTFSSNKREGIFITGTASPIIKKNVFTQNDGNGISVTTSAKGEIRDNVFDNTGFGIAVSQNAQPLIAQNRIVNNMDGIYLNDNSRPILRSNVIENNRRDGLVVTIAAKPDLGTAQEAGNNVLRNNGQYDLNNSTRDPVYSVGNTLDTKRTSGQVQFVAPPIAGQPGQSTFSDVQGHWAEAYIDALTKRGVITGFPDGLFHPSDPVTRAQFATILSKAFTPASQQAGIAFQDVSSSFWGYQAIQTAVRGGFMKGYPDGTFRSDQRIPRVQVLVALASGLGFGAGNTSLLSRYQDAAAVPAWAADAVAAATQRKVVVNYPTLTQLSPNRDATRAEVAAFVYQALVNAGKAEAVSSPYVVSP